MVRKQVGRAKGIPGRPHRLSSARTGGTPHRDLSSLLLFYFFCIRFYLCSRTNFAARDGPKPDRVYAPSTLNTCTQEIFHPLPDSRLAYHYVLQAILIQRVMMFECGMSSHSTFHSLPSPPHVPITPSPYT